MTLSGWDSYRGHQKGLRARKFVKRRSHKRTQKKNGSNHILILGEENLLIINHISNLNMKSKFVNLLYLVVPIVFFLGIASNYVFGSLSGRWYPVLVSWPLIFLALLYITFSVKALKPLDSSVAEISSAEVFWQQWAGKLWIFWGVYMLFSSFIPDTTVYTTYDLGIGAGIGGLIVLLQLIIVAPLSLFVQFSSHRRFWRFFSLCTFALQGFLFVMDHSIL